MSEDVSEFQRNILTLILRENRRPSAIASTLRRYDKNVDQNRVMIALLDLEQRGLVERSTTKAWIAKSRASDLVDTE
ncbi:MAG: hypothetical protein RTU63_02920 [Candidatus Thorarchaeota archaeon]